MDISILIPTLNSRHRLFAEVLADVRRQIAETPEIRVEVLWESDNGELTLGAKRNVLVDRCQGKYHCFIDDDDVLAPYFLRTFVPMIQSRIDYDCASFVGAHYHAGKFMKLFNHSLLYKDWFETPERYYRCPSPMNLIKTSIARQVRYKDIRNTEDHEFSMRLLQSGLLTTEFEVNPNRPLYHYVDGVKEDRERWMYRWIGDFLQLYRAPEPSDFHVPAQANTGNALQFLKLSH
jgi:glycosyltransferase involved in cell wall biosynthesis